MSQVKNCLNLALKIKFYHPSSRGFHTSLSRHELVKVEEADGLRKITMVDNKTRNSLSMSMMENLIAAIENDKSDIGLRSIMISAAPGPVFSAGHNLKEMTAEQGISQQKAIFAKCNELMISIRKSEVPVFAVVQGLAAAAGCQLVAACDFAIASERAKFSTPGANFGLFCTTPGIAVARSINRPLAAYMVLTGLPLSAQEAYNAGLIARICSDSEIESCIQEIHESIRSKSRPVIKLGKEAFYKQIELKYESALSEGADIMVENLQFQDCQEGLQSFKEKRKPTWSHLDKKVKSS